MKTNGGTINLSKINNTQQIKVNRKLNNNNPNINNVQIYPDYYQYYNVNQNKLIIDENKHVKYESYLDPNTYDNNIIFTEYDSLPKYSINPTSTYKLSSNELRAIYSNTNGNINNRGNLIPINNQNNFKINNMNDDNYTNRSSMGRQRKVTSYKGYKRTNLFANKNNNNSNMKENSSSSLINHKSNFQRGTKLNISKSEIQYPMNYFKDIPRSKSKIRSISKDNNNTEGDNEDKKSFHISKEKKRANKNEQVGNYTISSPRTNFSTKKHLRQNKSNIALVNRRKNNVLKPENSINSNHMKTLKSSNLNQYSKNENETINSYNSCYNFYQKDNNKKRLNNENNNIMSHTMNNFGLYNINSFQGNNNNINNLYASINNHEIYQNENKNGSNYINIIEQDFQNNNIINNENMNSNEDNISINMNMNMPAYIRGNENIQISDNIDDLNNQEMPFNNILSPNNILTYKKKIIEEFCHSLEEFIFISVKNNFDTFIFKLREYCKEKYFNELLFKRMQNKTIKKNFYKERASSYKYFEDNLSKPFYSTVLNDNNKFNNNREESNLNNLIKGYMGRKTYNNYNNSRVPPLIKDMPRLTTMHRPGKSQGRLDKNNIDNCNNYNYYYQNNNYNNNLYESNNSSENNYNNENYERKTSTDRYKNNFGEHNLYIPKKLKKINDNFALNNYREKPKNKKINLFSYFNTVENHSKLNRLLSQENEINKSHDINDDNIRSIKQNYNMTQSKNNNIVKDISYDNNCYDYMINKELGNGESNNKSDINSKQNRAQLNNQPSLGNIKNNKKGNKPVYKKKIKITQAKSRITKNNARNNYKNRIITSNDNDNNRSEQLLYPNLNIKSKNKIKQNKIVGQKSFEENTSNNLKQIKLTNSGEIKELNIDLSNRQNINGNINENANEKNTNEDLNRNKKTYDNGNIEIRKDFNENNNEESNINDNNENINTNNNDCNEMSNGNNVINEDTDESEENVIKEIIVKDVSTRDKRLNVFIKYIEMQGLKKNSNKVTNNHLLCLLQTDSIYLPASIQRKYYGNNYYCRNPDEKSNKLKFQKILCSIIEEEEKSKAAGSVNNSSISEEEIIKNGNFTHFYIQSVKYLTSYLQSIFDDKKKDTCFHFFKTLRKIKNDAFLKGLINQKKFQTFNKLNDEEENENNTSGDVILYNVNDNFNVDINYFGSKSNDRRDISIARNRTKMNEIDNNNCQKNGKEKNEEKNLKIEEEEIDLEEKYDSANNFCLLNDENLNKIMKNMNLSVDNSDKKDSKNKNNSSFSYFKEEKERKMSYKNKKNYQKLKKLIENLEEFNNLRIIENIFKKWKQIKDENHNMIYDNREENEYGKHVTMSEACNGLSDVILDFKIYLIKYALKNQMNSKVE